MNVAQKEKPLIERLEFRLIRIPYNPNCLLMNSIRSRKATCMVAPINAHFARTGWLFLHEKNIRYPSGNKIIEISQTIGLPKQPA